MKGTLDLLILRTPLLGLAHGHRIAKAIQFNSDDVLQVERGSLYPAPHWLIKRRWISVEDGPKSVQVLNGAGLSSCLATLASEGITTQSGQLLLPASEMHYRSQPAPFHSGR
jgi:hypothetical protein